MRNVLVLLAALLGLSHAQTGRLAFVTPAGALATLTATGEALRVLSDGGAHQFPAWSPLGEQVAVIGADAVGAFVQVYRDEPGATPTELYRSTPSSASGGPIYLYWSPDGQTVSFLAAGPNTLELHLAPLSGAPYVLASGQPFYWQWQGDSQGVLLHSGFAGEGARLGFSDADRDSLADNLAPPGRFQAPGIAPSGHYLAYATLAFAGQSQLVLASRAGAPQAVTRQLEHQGLVALGWNPAQDLLAFISPSVPAPHFYGPLRLLGAADGLLETVTEDLVLAFFWSPDGQRLAYLTPASTRRDAPLAQGGVRRVQQQLPLLELWLFELGDAAPRLLSTFAPSPLFVTQFLPFFDQYALSHRLWSPDSRALALPVLSGSGVAVAVVTLEGDVSLVAPGDMPFWSHD